ncbi:MBL fold metallo-hydrolase [Hymenobacter sp.]|uniref:MBL fold metallo-hydrolase n=1 Tax=Hymenobacter sp. TaxID=1898978 RepID=UPI002ED8BF76
MRTYLLFRRLLLLIPLFASGVVEAQTLKVTLLGTGAPFPRIDRFGPSILLEAGSTKLLFDCGRGASQRLWQLKIPLGVVNTVFFTHLHSDHTVGFPDLWLTGWLPAVYGRWAVPMQVFGPEGTATMMAALKQACAWDLSVRQQGQGPSEAGTVVTATNISQGVVYQQGGVKVTALDVKHGEGLKPAFGYRVDYAGHSVVFSGDTGPSDNLVKFAQGAEVVVHEVAAAREGLVQTSATAREILSFHTQPEEAGQVLARIKPKLAVYSHIVLLSTDPSIPPPTDQELLPRTRKTYSGRVELGEDLMSIEIGSEVTVRRFVPPSK